MITRDSSSIHGAATTPEAPSSKRRWSPSTWRYAIEELQPDIRPRYSSSYLNGNGSSHGYDVHSSQFLGKSVPYRLPSFLTDRHSQLFQQQKQRWSKLREGLGDEDDDGFLPETYRYGKRHGNGKPVGALTASTAVPQKKIVTAEVKKKPKIEESNAEAVRGEDEESGYARQRNPNPNVVAAATEEADLDEGDDVEDEDAGEGNEDSESAIATATATARTALESNDSQRWRREMSPAERYFCPVCSSCSAGAGASGVKDRRSGSRPASPS